MRTLEIANLAVEELFMNLSTPPNRRTGARSLRKSESIGVVTDFDYQDKTV